MCPYCGLGADTRRVICCTDLGNPGQPDSGIVQLLGSFVSGCVLVTIVVRVQSDSLYRSSESVRYLTLVVTVRQYLGSTPLRLGGGGVHPAPGLGLLRICSVHHSFSHNLSISFHETCLAAVIYAIHPKLSPLLASLPVLDIRNLACNKVRWTGLKSPRRE